MKGGVVMDQIVKVGDTFMSRSVAEAKGLRFQVWLSASGCWSKPTAKKKAKMPR